MLLRNVLTSKAVKAVAMTLTVLHFQEILLCELVDRFIFNLLWRLKDIFTILKQKCVHEIQFAKIMHYFSSSIFCTIKARFSQDGISCRELNWCRTPEPEIVSE